MNARWMGALRRAFGMAPALLSVLAGACALDPIHQSEVDALGGETPGVPQGPFHRAGQPCTVCHGPEGPASQRFSLAGTVFAGLDRTVGVDQAEILMVDALGSSPPPGSVITNCVGNFFVPPEVWTPAYPIRVAVSTASGGAEMIAHIGRDGSCASCHADPAGLASPGHVYVATSATPEGCPVNPVAGNGKAVTP
jgi:hypothetical protein